MEVAVNSEGCKVIPRIKPNRRWNKHYNANRRDILEHVNPSQVPIEVVTTQGHSRLGGYRLSRQSMSDNSYYLASGSGKDTDKAGRVEITVLYATWTAAPVSSSLALYPVIGLDKSSGQKVVTLTDKMCSIIDAPKEDLYAYPYNDMDNSPPSATLFLYALWSYITSCSIISNTRKHSKLIIISPSPIFAKIIKHISRDKSIETVSVAGLENLSNQFTPYVHPLAASETILKKLGIPFYNTTAVEIVYFGGKDDDLAERIAFLLGDSLLNSIDVYASRDRPRCILNRDGSSAALLAQTSLQEGIKLAAEHTGRPLPKDSHAVEHITPLDIPTISSSQREAIIDWSANETIPIPIVESDSIPLCRPNGTYLLIGLGGTGGLGLSLAEWMVGQGARNIVLTSRNPEPDPAWIADLAAQGVRVEMIANDVTDRASVQELVAGIRRSWPPIIGVANGAMVLHDTALEAMTYNQMMRVLRPKVDGTQYLDDLFRHDKTLDFFVLFSSLSSVFGNSGQANYAASNMYGIALCAQRRRRGVPASIIDVGAIMGIGYMAREVGQNVLAQLVENGYRKLSERDLHVAFANAILAGRVGSDQPEELIMGLSSVVPSSNKSKLEWTDNPRFSHVTKAASLEAGGSGDANRIGALVALRDLLQQATTSEQVNKVVRDSVLGKLRIMLQLRTAGDADGSVTGGEEDEARRLLEQTADDLGVDSLVAVELRSWFLKELDVSIPVLKILGGGTMQELVEYAVESLPADLVPKLDADQELTAAIKSSSASVAAVSVAPSVFTADADKPGSSGNQSDTDASDTPSRANSTKSLGKEDNVFTAIGINNTGNNAATFPDIADARDIQGEAKVHFEKVAPISFGQSRFWFMSRFSSDKTAFNVTASFRIVGAINVADLTLAVRALGRRHKGLRTSFFDSEDSQPKQGVLPESLLHLETKSVAPVASSSGHQQSTFSDEFEALKNYVFDLERGETMRIMLLTQSRTQHHLLVAYHHINMDGASLGILIADLQRMYMGEKLSPPALQYTAFSEHQRQRQGANAWKDELAFWRNEFATLPSVLPILSLSPEALTRHRPVMSTYRHIQHEAYVSPQLASKIRPLCRRIGINPFHLYMTVFQVLLSRFRSSSDAEESDICIGVADANRGERGAMEAVGNFLNLFPVRLPATEAALDAPFSAIARQTRKKIVESMANAAVPLDVVLEEIKTPRSATHSPLFQAFIDYRLVNEKGYLRNAEMESKKYAISATPYDIMLDIVDTPLGTASVSFLVQEGLYTRQDAEVLSKCFLNAMWAFAEEPETLASKVQLFNSNEVEIALKLGRGT